MHIDMHIPIYAHIDMYLHTRCSSINAKTDTERYNHAFYGIKSGTKL